MENVEDKQPNLSKEISDSFQDDNEITQKQMDAFAKRMVMKTVFSQYPKFEIYFVEKADCSIENFICIVNGEEAIVFVKCFSKGYCYEPLTDKEFDEILEVAKREGIDFVYYAPVSIRSQDSKRRKENLVSIGERLYINQFDFLQLQSEKPESEKLKKEIFQNRRINSIFKKQKSERQI